MNSKLLATKPREDGLDLENLDAAIRQFIRTIEYATALAVRSIIAEPIRTAIGRVASLIVQGIFASATLAAYRVSGTRHRC